MKNRLWNTVLLGIVGSVMVGTMAVRAQDAAAPEAPAVAPQAAAAGAETPEPAQRVPGLWQIIISSGTVGVILWLGLALCSVAGVALIIDSFITIKDSKIAPPELVSQVREAMEQGDVMKAIKHCEERPTPLSSILTAGFSNVQEGFDVIQEAVGVSAELETEKLMQRVSYLNMCANLSPMLGLLGTVQGMIFAFNSLATAPAGSARDALLALNISQALWTTAVGLLVAIPAISLFTYFKNRASKIILGMEGLTMDLIKSLRNVEVVEAGSAG